MKRWDDAEFEKLINFNNKGLSYSEIAVEINRTIRSIKNKLNTFFKKSNKVIAYIPYTSLESILINGNSLVTSKNAIKSDYLKT